MRRSDYGFCEINVSRELIEYIRLRYFRKFAAPHYTVAFLQTPSTKFRLPGRGGHMVYRCPALVALVIEQRRFKRAISSRIQLIYPTTNGQELITSDWEI